MRIMSPKLAFKHNIIYDQSDIIKYRNKLDLYEKYKSGDLLIWINNNLAENIQYKMNEFNDLEYYYRVINMLDNSLKIENERKEFYKLLNEIKTLKNGSSKHFTDKLKKLVLQYELFFNELEPEDIKEFLYDSLSIFVGFSAIFDVCKDQISISFSSKIIGIIAEGYKGNNFKNNHVIRVDADSQRYIEIGETFIIKNCQGPLTINSYNPRYKNNYEKNKSIEFLDVDSKNEKEVLKRLFLPTSIELKHPLAFIEYIEVDNYEL